MLPHPFFCPCAPDSLHHHVQAWGGGGPGYHRACQWVDQCLGGGMPTATWKGFCPSRSITVPEHCHVTSHAVTSLKQGLCRATTHLAHRLLLSLESSSPFPVCPQVQKSLGESPQPDQPLYTRAHKVTERMWPWRTSPDVLQDTPHPCWRAS